MPTLIKSIVRGHRKSVILSLSFLGSLLFLTAVANATTIYQQPSVWTGNGTTVGSAWTSQADSNPNGSSRNGFREYDNFTLSSAAVINQVSWLGIYVDATTLLNAPINTTDWVIRFTPDNGNQPVAPVTQETLPATQVTRQALGSGLYGSNPVTVYQFTALFPDFNAAAHTQYWFSPLSRATDFSPTFSWIEGIGGDGISFQVGFSGGSNTDSFYRGGDRAFTLSNVPEPSSIFLLGVGFPLVRLFRRRIKHCV